jgi:hypothetical protein
MPDFLGTRPRSAQMLMPVREPRSSYNQCSGKTPEEIERLTSLRQDCNNSFYNLPTATTLPITRLVKMPRNVAGCVLYPQHKTRNLVRNTCT